MKSLLTFAVVLGLALCAGAAAPLRAQNLWIVASPEPIDARLSRQIEALARHRRAKVSFLHVAARDLKNQPGKLIISLEQASNPAAFESELGKVAATSAAPPTAATAEQGYILNVSATYPSGAERITARAAANAGFHNALLRLPEILAFSRGRRRTEIAPPAKSWTLIESGRNSFLLMADFPSFAQRGTIASVLAALCSRRDSAGAAFSRLHLLLLPLCALSDRLERIPGEQMAFAGQSVERKPASDGRIRTLAAAGGSSPSARRLSLCTQSARS